MLRIKCAACGSVIGAETAGLAAIAAALRDRLSRREIDHIKGVGVTQRIVNRPRQVTCSDLGQNFRLDLRVSNGRTVVARCRNNLKQSAERAITKNLARASGNVRVVLLHQGNEPGAGDITKEVAHGGRCGSGNLRIVRTTSVQHLHHLDVRNDRSTMVRQVRAGRSRESYYRSSRVGISPWNTMKYWRGRHWNRICRHRGLLAYINGL